MESYHATSSASRADESLRTEYVSPLADSCDNPFAVVTIPPVGRLLECICMRLSVGGCFRPGNRQLADWLDYASASQIPYLLSELACKGWIDYDPTTRLITLLRTYRSDQAIRSIDRFFFPGANDVRSDDSALIDPIDRDLGQQDAENENDQIDRSNPQRMEDHVLVTTADSESVAVRYKLPCGENSISRIDQPVALLLSELLKPPGRGVLDKVLAAQPPWTPQEIRDRYESDKPRIENSGGKKTWGIFWNALMAGERAPKRADPDRPLEPADYADDPGFRLGSDLAPPTEAQRNAEAYADAHWRAVELLGRGAPFREMAIVVEALVAGDSDEAALAALAVHRRAVRR